MIYDLKNLTILVIEIEFLLFYLHFDFNTTLHIKNEMLQKEIYTYFLDVYMVN